MRHLISGLVAAVAVMAAAPAMACGYTSCAPVAYAAPLARYKTHMPELPEVEMASNTSPARPNARTCFANT